MNVIPFRRSEFDVYFFYDKGVNVVRKWFSDAEIPEVAWIAFCSTLDIYEACGLAAIRSCIVDLENGFWGLKISQRGGPPPCPIFRAGPFDEKSEITFLAGGRWDENKKRVRPYSALGVAEENLELLLEDRTRRRRG